MNELDLNLISLYRVNGQELALLPGLLVQNSPKKAARGRELDRLLVYLTLAGNVSYSATEYAQIVGDVAETFYNTAGSLTFALKIATEQINSFLVERNMRSTGKGLYSIGALVLCNLRGSSMYVVQSGPTHVYHLGAEVRHLYEPQLAGKGLGLSQTAHMYFAQVSIKPGERLLVCAALPPNWDKSLTEGHGSTALEATRRRLLAITNTNVSAVLLQAAEGSGALNIMPAIKETVQAASPELGVSAGAQQPSAVVEGLPPQVEAPVLQVEKAGLDKVQDEEILINKVKSEEVPVDELESEEVHAEQLEPEEVPVEPLETEEASADAAPSAARRTHKARENNFLQAETRDHLMAWLRHAAGGLAGAIQRGRGLTQKLAGWSETAIPRLLPGENPIIFSRAWLIFFAIAIPVVFFFAARFVYYQFGYQAQYQSYYQRADQAAQQALAESNPITLRVEWQSTLDWLDKADQFQETASPDSKELRRVAQKSLDNLDGIVRTDFVPAFSATLNKNLQVSRMAASDTDLYLLDSAQGSVLRGVFNGQNYVLDGTFQCGPGNYNGIQVSQLIDIIALPRSNPSQSTLLALDASGNLLYCIPGANPVASYLQLPDIGWKTITTFALDGSNLYVLDAPAHAVWVYFGNSEIMFPEKPYFFFESQVPVMLEEAIGMAINGDDLFLLHRDGHMTTCTLSRIDVAPTRCNDPALYVDKRLGHQGGMRLSDGVFSQITFIGAPNPAIALLEPFTQSVFRFSAPALELQNQVRAKPGKENPLPKGAPVTAMAVSPNKFLFVFVDNQVFFASNMP